jgi:uncharacterized membrane protein
VDFHQFETVLNNIMLVVVVMLEIFGAIVVFYGSALSFFRFIHSHMEGRQIRLTFSRYLVFGLEFKLAGEIIRTVVVRSFEEVAILAAIIVLRATLNFIVHWEMKQEESGHG